jgi:hypothetical protein
VVFGIQKIMVNRTAFSLKVPLVCWNLMLTLFSLYGVWRSVPPMLQLLYRDGLYATTCEPMKDKTDFGPHALSLWLFTLSKIPELGDTIFIVLRKKPLILLHWYHHISVLFVVFQACGTQSPT